jgi:hypothetical protein
MMSTLAVAVLCTVAARSEALAAEAPGKTNVVAGQVNSIRTFGERTDPALLLVYVTDHHGNPLEGIEVTLAEGRQSRGRGTTGRDGTALMRLAMTGRLTVRAAHVGFVTAEARLVSVKKGGFTAIALPLEVAQPGEILSE